MLLDAGTVLIPAEKNAPPFEVAEVAHPFEELLQRAHATRPDLAALRAELGARQKQLSAAKSWGFPGVLAEGRVGGFGEDPSSFKDQQAFFLSVGWDFGPGITGRYHRAAAEVQEAGFQQQLLERRIAAEIATALQGIRTMQSMREAASREAEASREGLELARSRFQAGEALLLEVVDMQAALARAELHATRAAIEHKRMQLDLLYSIGGPRK